MKSAAYPHNEMDRIMALSDFNLDYTNLDDAFKDLAKLAAKVSGSPISLVNLIDNYTVWTIADYGLEITQTPREESICQYTILEKEKYEVNDLSASPNFKDEDFVTGDAHFRFYYGLPLNSDGLNLGALCVIDTQAKSLEAEKVELLKIIADEIINRLKVYKYIDALRSKVRETQQTQNKVVHDIRGPVAGIMGLAEIISQQGQDNNLDEVLEFISLIHKSGKSILQLAEEILTEEKKSQVKVKNSEMTLSIFRKRLEELYTPQAKTKDITFTINITADKDNIAFPQNKLMQIAGNLISNAMKFTPRSGSVSVTLDLHDVNNGMMLNIAVKDTGAGIENDQIQKLLADNTESKDGTDGEKGFGFGLALVKHLVKGLHGTFNIVSEKNEGSRFEVSLPVSS